MTECPVKTSLHTKLPDNLISGLIQQNGAIYRLRENLMRSPLKSIDCNFKISIFLKKVIFKYLLILWSLSTSPYVRKYYHNVTAATLKFVIKIHRHITFTYSQSMKIIPGLLDYDSTSPIILKYIFENTKHWFYACTHAHAARGVQLHQRTLLIIITKGTRRHKSLSVSCRKQNLVTY
jgi:hypothetical protein